jgi:hypothetical protein
MNRTDGKKLLSFRRETLRALTAQDLLAAKGNGTTSRPTGSRIMDGCSTTEDTGCNSCYCGGDTRTASMYCF